MQSKDTYKKYTPKSQHHIYSSVRMYITRTTMVICLTIFMSMTVSVLSGACALESERRKKARKKTAYIVRLSRIPRYLSSLLYKRGQKGKHFKASLISWLRVFSLIVVLALLFIRYIVFSICIIVIITCLRG